MSVLTTFNARQSSLMRHTLSDVELAGLRSMIETEVSRWLNGQLKEVEEHFPKDADDTYRDILERFLIYLVSEHGVPDERNNKFYNVTAASMNHMIGSSAQLDIEDDNSVTLTVRKNET